MSWVRRYAPFLRSDQSSTDITSTHKASGAAMGYLGPAYRVSPQSPSGREGDGTWLFLGRPESGAFEAFAPLDGLPSWCSS